MPELEFWKPIPNWPKYQVSNKGRVRRVAGKTSNGKSWKGKILKEGINVVLSDGKRYWNEKICRLVLLAFVGPAPKGLECCHKDDNQINNDLSNLRWDTHKANAQDALKNGRMCLGNRISTTKLTEKDVKQIRKLYKPARGVYKRGGATGESIEGSTRWLAKKYGVSCSTICIAIKRETWKQVK